MNRRPWKTLGFVWWIVAGVLAVAVLLLTVFGRGTTADGRLQFMGAVLGGLATMIGVVLTLAEGRTRQSIEYRPRIVLEKSGRIFAGRYFVCFPTAHSRELERNRSAYSVAVPLKIRNIGRSDVVVEEIIVTKNGQSRSWQQPGTQKAGPFCIFSEEEMDVPVQIDLDDLADHRRTFGLTVRFCQQRFAKREAETPMQEKTYEIYVPRKDGVLREDGTVQESAYRDWVQQIYLSGRDASQSEVSR